MPPTLPPGSGTKLRSFFVSYRASPRLTDPTLHTMDPPERNPLRRLISAAFSPRQIDRLADHVRYVTDDLLDRVEDQGPPTGVVDGLPLPIAEICHMLGVLVADRDRLPAGSTSPWPPRRSPRRRSTARSRGSRTTWPSLSRHAATPSDDLLDALVEARDSDDRLSENELVVLGATLLYAGMETTSNHIGNQLRRAHATYLISNGVSIEAVRRRLGHARAETTQLFTLLADKFADDKVRTARRRHDIRS